MRAIMPLLRSKPIILPNNLGKKVNKKELKQEKTELREEKEEREDNLVKIVGHVNKDLAETESKVKKEVDKEDVEETTDSDI
jgi:hypothetical protein